MKNFVILFCLFLAVPLLAEFRIATVDINRVINESTESKSMKKVLDDKTLAAKKQVDAKRSSLKALEDKLKAAKVKEDSKEADQYRESAKEYSRMVKDTEEDLRREFLKSNKTLTDKALKLVRDYASKNSYSLVLDKSEAVRGPVLFGSKSFDVTEDILKQVD